MDGVTDLDKWWMETAADDLSRVSGKAREYGSADLDIMGLAMVRITDWRAGEEHKRQIGQELAISHYLLGKVSRMFGAYANGQLPSEDTQLDTTIYSMMLRRARAEGGWPA